MTSLALLLPVVCRDFLNHDPKPEDHLRGGSGAELGSPSLAPTWICFDCVRLKAGLGSFEGMVENPHDCSSKPMASWSTPSLEAAL